MSIYIGRRVLLRDAHGDWWDCLCTDLTEENGIMHYDLRLDNGDRMLLPIEDVTGILEKKKAVSRKRGKVIQFPVKFKQRA